MPVTLSKIIKIMETIAPSYLAEEWDNVGLQLGQNDWQVRKIWVALDPLPDVVSAACDKNVDMLITHHPLIFRPLSALDFNTTVGSIIHRAIQCQMAVFSAHTNLDSVTDGLNDILAKRIGLNNLEIAAWSANSGLVAMIVLNPGFHSSSLRTGKCGMTTLPEMTEGEG